LISILNLLQKAGLQAIRGDQEGGIYIDRFQQRLEFPLSLQEYGLARPYPGAAGGIAHLMAAGKEALHQDGEHGSALQLKGSAQAEGGCILGNKNVHGFSKLPLQPGYIT
jgi:hypothetical protein